MSIEGQGHFFNSIFQVLYVLCFTRPRYQVSVYRNIGPLVCANYDPWLILTYFTARSNFATWAFTWKNDTLMDSLEFIASCDLEFG